MESEIKILIIEDEALIAQKIKMQLEDFGYSIVDICYDYESAAIAINEISFDVLITDINLGNGIEIKSGIQIAQQLKQTKDCPIIFLTAFSDADTIKKATALSPSAYMVKPVNEANLYATVQLAVNNYLNKITPQLEKEEAPNFFFVKQGTKYVKVFWKDVYHLEALKNYVKITTIEQRNGVLVNGSLQNVLQKMMPLEYRDNFIKINRAEAIIKSIIQKVGEGIVETEFGEFETTKEFAKELLKS
jgi:two-component system, LytTR family, response regulator LytT